MANAEEAQRRAWDRMVGSVPWLKLRETKHYKVKVFKSGNSVALRLPAELNLQPGTEMNLRVDDGEQFSFEPIDRPKRKLNVMKFWGSIPDLVPIKPEDRVFEPSKRPWDDSAWPGWSGETR